MFISVCVRTHVFVCMYEYLSTSVRDLSKPHTYVVRTPIRLYVSWCIARIGISTKAIMVNLLNINTLVLKITGVKYLSRVLYRYVCI